MDPKRLLTLMAERLYEDIRFVTEQNPTQIVDDDGARAYNSIIARVRKIYPFVENVADFPDWSPRTIKYKDALVVSGQLAAMLRALLEPAGPMRQGPPPPPQQPGLPISGSTQGVPSMLSAPTSLGLSAQTSVPVGQVAQGQPIPRPATQNLSPSTQGYPRPQMPQMPQQVPPSSGGQQLPPPRPQPPEAMASAPPSPHDKELYGPNAPSRRNDDGTIPFSME